MKSRFLGYTTISVLYSTIFLTFTITHFGTAAVHMCNPAGFRLHVLVLPYTQLTHWCHN